MPHNVSGMTFGLIADVPDFTGSADPLNPTDAEKDAAYAALAYTFSQTCIITGLPVIDESWGVNQDPVTICDQKGAIRKSFKTFRQVANASMSFIFEKTDPLIVLFNQLRESRDQVGTFELGHSDGINKIWGQIQVLRTVEDPTDNEGRVQFTVDFFYEETPHRN